MILKEYIAHLEVMIKTKPEILEMQVYYSSDDEGNSFDLVGFKPSLMILDSDAGDVSEEDAKDFPDAKRVVVIN